MMKPQIPILKLRGTPTAKTGQVVARVGITHRGQDGTEIIQYDQPNTNTFPAEGPALAGVGFGLTLPGPEKSYLTARIDAFCYIPCEASEEGVKGAMAKASELVQEQLEGEAREAKKFFEEWKR